MISQKLSCPQDRVLIDSNTLFCIKQAVRYACPEEACGVLLGDRETGMIRDAWCVENRTETEDSRWYYRIDPLQMRSLEHRAESDGYEIIGFYHSHVEAEAIPSGEDRDRMIPGMVYLIVPVFGGRPGRARAYGKDAAEGTVEEMTVSMKESR